jgi:hypothetical protein
MRRHKSNSKRESDTLSRMASQVAEVLTKRSGMNKDLLIALANAVAANEKAQRRFRTVVLMRLARIETTLQMVHGAQIVEGHKSQPCFDEKMTQHAKDAEDYISQHSNELGLKMVKYIYK